MPKSKSNRGALLLDNLPQLQGLIKRDPDGYKDEFIQQYNHYQSQMKIFQLQPNSDLDKFSDLVGFIAQVASCYPKETAEFPAQLSSLIIEYHNHLTPDTRKTLVQSLVLLRNRQVIPSIDLLKVLFQLLPITTSATLRSYIRNVILTDIKLANQRSKNHKLNRVVQALLFSMVERGMDAEVQSTKSKAKKSQDSSFATKAGAEAMWAVMLTRELWKKGVWNDAKTVSIVALACFHPTAKVQNAAVHFFLGSDDAIEESEDEGEDIDMKKVQHQALINKSRKSVDKKVAKQKKAAKKQQANKDNASTPNFPALQLLNDPQGFSEKLFESLTKTDKVHSLDHRVLVMQLLTRVMGAHKLCVLSFYSYVIKYLTHHQLRITLILVAIAQSVHELTPPDVLTPVIRKLAHEFVTPGVGSEVVAAGLNAITEICRRQPWAMESDLLEDLIEYRKSADKGVLTASRGLLQLFREVNPGMLKRKERGKLASMGLSSGKEVLKYGQSGEAASGIEGLDLLEKHLADKDNEGEGDEEDEEKAWDDWDVESGDESSESEGWVNVSDDDDDEINLSDSDDEDSKKKKKEKKDSEEQAEKATDEPKEESTDDAIQRLSTLATERILTPADFALLNDLKMKAVQDEIDQGGGAAAKRKMAQLKEKRKAQGSGADGDDEGQFVTEAEIIGPRKRAKNDYEARMESINQGREGREKFSSRKGKHKSEKIASKTNEEKKRNKPMMMAIHSKKVKSKSQSKLIDKQKALHKHKEKQRKKGF
ncbi:SDA1-domain-containing protein [Wallemia mellicola]|uniref:Protein SDA1 n=1 Tax=Wallemia mellicola TaxID=1708541 RepID=A0A4T0PC01_9BASI|nr:hypothetical protein E3Q23_04058 [Wallemia mellicola]TIB75078.1 SDA1-domain-containing protein [Wallemia mellicola]TIB79854.1 SDA1-domain-containing protein [Wallemia mellicola]TIB83836.1 SDA1-domain-containing protein [Wallemia mellicola]TIB94940.1 SDA1-domain-containing protein [Wallemia mellicola]